MYPSSRNINDLHPRLRAIFVRFDTAMIKAGIDFIVTCTYRSNADQDRLFAQGRTAGGRVVTNAKAGQSKHNHVGIDEKPESLAFDIVIMTDGKPDWNVDNPSWKIAGKIGRSVGLTWAGDWVRFKEFPHFEISL